MGNLLVLLLGNSGPSIAHNVKVRFDPPPSATLDIAAQQSLQATSEVKKPNIKHRQAPSRALGADSPRS
jgi:hypothetical protein